MSLNCRVDWHYWQEEVSCNIRLAHGSFFNVRHCWRMVVYNYKREIKNHPIWWVCKCIKVIRKVVRCICAIHIQSYFTDLVSKELQNSNILHDCLCGPMTFSKCSKMLYRDTSDSRRVNCKPYSTVTTKFAINTKIRRAKSTICVVMCIMLTGCFLVCTGEFHRRRDPWDDGQEAEHP